MSLRPTWRRPTGYRSGHGVGSFGTGRMAVHIGARVSALAGPGEVLVSSTVKDSVVESSVEFAERGEHELKGVLGTWRLFAVGN